MFKARGTASNGRRRDLGGDMEQAVNSKVFGWAEDACGCEEGKVRQASLDSTRLTITFIAKNKYVVSMSYFLPDKENSHSARNLNVYDVFKGTVTKVRSGSVVNVPSFQVTFCERI